MDTLRAGKHHPVGFAESEGADAEVALDRDRALQEIGLKVLAMSKQAHGLGCPALAFLLETAALEAAAGQQPWNPE
jgi:hypothetical protein